MATTELSVERVGRTVGYLLLGLLGTVFAAMVLLNITEPVQRPVYDALYLGLGPSGATEAALVTQFLGSTLVALAVPLLVGDFLSTRLANRDAIAAALVTMLVLLLGFLAAIRLGVTAVPFLFGVLAVALLGIPLLLYYRYDVRSGALPAFVGGIPAVLLLLVLLAFGLGWGWGYVVTAEQVPASSVDDSEAVSLAESAALEAALFAPDNCDTDGGGMETCDLYLRGHEHERTLTRSLADIGVRCPYRGTGADGGTAVVRRDGNYYRVSCYPHGD